ncbi:M20 family metallopeptidase [Paractinoplanes brasiliensis]|uniref:Succinyl-diaminopimelate desuccinylase n=1 Tax=Paractinoplanes brasiliensis TaxID=52695 RepID=A0A4R6K0M3_9ACTN|nr:M20/M25/M40 family metallo-hydrolase [Actinoplanes brasiliensis]TDO42619.1 succinyl-diaminopimelate desuccinylase [Actinoplanes brasiliensis]GID31278.1 peptidase M20 [Actinoplanes brasiliensis]
MDHGVDLRRLVGRACDLIAMPSTSERPDELRRALEFVLDEVGPRFAVRRFLSNGKPSALVHRPGDEHFRVVLNAHLDVVPALPEQFVPRVEGDRLYGRGAQDMKVAALVMADVFRRLAPTLDVPVALQLVTDEEVGGADGTAHQIAQGVRADFVVIGEQSGLRVVNESRGLAHVRLTAKGRAAHAAYPWLGENALVRVVEAINALLRRYPVPDTEVWRTTVNVARVDTPNAAVNQVPDAASAWLDIRFPAGDDDWRSAERIEARLGELTGVTAQVEALGHPHHADPRSVEVKLLRQAARDAGFAGTLLAKHGAADGRHYTAAGVDAVIFGPGGDGQHGASEYADLTTLIPYGKALGLFLRSLSPRWPAGASGPDGPARPG